MQQTSAGFLVGALLLALGVVPMAAAAHAARRVLLPEADPLTAAIANGVLLVAAIIVVVEIIGAVGEFRRIPITLTLGIVGGTGWALLRCRSQAIPEAKSQKSATAEGRMAWVAIAACSVVVIEWGASLGAPLREGILDYDSLNYHLTLASGFAQSGSLAHVQYISPDSPVHLYPLNAELLHALGMLFLRSDELSVFVNMGWLVAVIACGWSIGRRFGAGPAAAVAAAIVMAVPVMAVTQAGTGGNDAAALASFLASVAIFVNTPLRTGALAVGGMAAGLAIGTKLTLIVPCAVLAVVALLTAPRGKRISAGLMWSAAALLTGGYWYGRNLLNFGSPNPGVHLGIGPVAFPDAHFLLIDRFGYSVAYYWNWPHVWVTMLIPGLAALGDAWPALLLLGAAACIVALSAGRAPLRGLAALAIIAAAAYLVTPTTALGFKGGPSLFAENTRYLTPALAMALIVGAALASERSDRWRRGSLGVLVLCLAVTLVPGTWDPWPSAHRKLGLAIGLLAAAAFIAGALGPRLLRRRFHRRLGWALTAAGLLFAAVLLAAENPTYERDRYTGGGLFTWAQHLRHARIAIAGFDRQFPLYGPDLLNYVQYVGAVESHGGFTTARSCQAWLWALRAGRFDYVATRADLKVEYPHPIVPEERWTLTDPGARVVFSGGGATVIKLLRPPDPSSCRSSTTARPAPPSSKAAPSSFGA